MSTTLDHADRLRALAGSGRAEIGAVHDLYDSLPPVAPAEMLGEWVGGVIPTGHPAEGRLRSLGWIGKTFRGADDVDPIVVRGPDGAREASRVLGAASLRSVEHRGVVTATMIYDNHPVCDHFRRAGDDVVLGLMDRKGDERPLAFWLERVG